MKIFMGKKINVEVRNKWQVSTMTFNKLYSFKYLGRLILLDDSGQSCSGKKQK